MVFVGQGEAQATVVGWETNWCAPVACDPNRTYYQGMSKADFKTTAAKTCGPVIKSTFDAPTLMNPRGGYDRPPEGFYSQGTAFQDLRWVAADPVWCTDSSTLFIPFRYYRYDPVAAWGLTANTAGFGGGPGTELKLTCLSNTGVVMTATDTSSSVQTSTTTSNALVSYPANGAPKTSDGSKSFSSQPFYISAFGNRPLWVLFNHATNCVTILNLTLTVRTDTIGGLSTIQWSAALAMNGKVNTWGADYEQLDCAVLVQPIECIGQNVAPSTIACKHLTVDPQTWGYLGPCMIGTPQDYIGGASITSGDLSALPVPGTGECAPWTLGTLYGSPFVLDVCDWYSPWRPVFDVLMTASLWVAFVASFFRTKAGT